MRGTPERVVSEDKQSQFLELSARAHTHTHTHTRARARARVCVKRWKNSEERRILSNQAQYLEVSLDFIFPVASRYPK